MTQLRLVWSSTSSETSLPATTKKFAKCARLRTTSSTRPSLWKKFERLQKENPIAAVMIEKLVDKALAAVPFVLGAFVE